MGRERIGWEGEEEGERLVKPCSSRGGKGRGREEGRGKRKRGGK